MLYIQIYTVRLVELKEKANELEKNSIVSAVLSVINHGAVIWREIL